MSGFPTDEQVEGAAEAAYDSLHGHFWDYQSPETKDEYREMTRAALTSVAPFVQSLEKRLDAQSQHVWVPVREMPGHVIRAIQ